MEVAMREAKARLSELGAAARNGERWPDEWNDPAFSRQVLGLDDE